MAFGGWLTTAISTAVCAFAGKVLCIVFTDLARYNLRPGDVTTGISGTWILDVMVVLWKVLSMMGKGTLEVHEVWEIEQHVDLQKHHVPYPERLTYFIN
jgi:hypothetical protein